MDPGPGSGLQAGDLIVGIVRRPDPVPCPNCAVGEWDMCRNGQYTERGIKQIDGFMSERWRIEPGYFTKLDPSLGILGVLLEPATVVAKAWELVGAMRARAFWEPRHALITGAGPIGMLAALIGVQHGLDVHVLDRVTKGAKPQLVADLGATYHTGAPAGTRMNDGACDPQGRFWGGTLADDHHTGGGTLYRLDREGRTEVVLEGLTISNGIGWSPDGRTMYLVDSAIYGGGRVNRYAPDGSLRDVYPIPARECTCCAFGGPGLHRLFVTTATEGWTDEQRRSDLAAGLVYRVDTDATGRPAAPYRPDPAWWEGFTR